MSTVRRTLSILMALTLFGAGVGAWYAYCHYSDPKVVRELLVRWLAQTCPKAKIEIGSAHASLLRGVQVDSISMRALENIDQQILTLRSVAISPDKPALLEGRLRVDQITLADPVLHLHQFQDGRWNLQSLLTGKKIRFPVPIDVMIKGARIRVTSEQPDFMPIELANVAGTVFLRPEGEAKFELEGANDLVRRFKIQGRVDFITQTVSIDARTMEGVNLAEAADQLPRSLRDKMADLRDLRGSVDLHVAGRAQRTDDGFEWDGKVEGECRHTAFDHVKLPYPVRDARGKFTASRKGFQCSELRFALGAAEGNFNVQVPAWDAQQIAVEGVLRGIELTPAVRRVLDARGQTIWDRFQPSGFADVSGRVIRLGDQLAIAGSAQLHDASLKFEKFPYPVDGAQGRFDLADDGSLRYRIEGRAGTAQVEIDGEMEGAPPPAAMLVTIKGKGLTLDETLMKAVAPQAAQVIRDLRPGATTGDFVCVVQRPRGSERIMHKIDVDIRSSEATYAGFPYRLTDVAGHLVVEPGVVRFHDCKGHSADALIEIKGAVWSQTQGSHVEVGVRARNLPVDDKLRKALPKPALCGIESIQAAGQVNLVGNVVQAPGEKLYVELDIDPAAMTIAPAAFPYKLEDFEGRVVYRDGRLMWNRLAAKHGDVQLECSGAFEGCETGGTLELRNLVSNNLVYDEGLRIAAPPNLRATLDFLSPTKPVGIRFPEVKLTWQTGNTKEWRVDLDGGISLLQAGMMPAVGLENVTGQIWYRGTVINDVPKFDGNVKLSEVTVEGFTATNVQSSFRVDETRIEMPNLRGQMYAGQLHGNVRAEATKDGKYESRFNLYGAKLRDYMRSRSKSPVSADGMVYLDLFLEGDSASVNKLRGRGKLDILEADIDRLPMLQDMFRIGNLQAPRGKAFEEVNCDFRVDDRMVMIETLDLLGPPGIVGPSFNLFSDGEGSLNIDNWQINLAVSARWGRGQIRVPVLTPSFNLASDQVFSFNVTGTLDNPDISPAPLKGFTHFFGGQDSNYARRRLSR
ncbi:AsmA-like C-terminal region-containing protein [bacterium]|nr:AsmA-like C-terminal region-containing protein [bacterium]